jgi:DNA topoisomerase-1
MRGELEQCREDMGLSLSWITVRCCGQSHPRSGDTRSTLSEPAEDSVNSIAPNGIETAKAIGLRYVSDLMPGFRRIGTNKAFRYLDTEGHVIRNAETLERIRRLAIPPAWTEVWICPIPHGHLQAVGRDARGRKQYRYHPHWREARDETKYDRMLAFAQALPKIRRRVERDLRDKTLTRNKVLATIVRLLETTFIRIGNKEYQKHNDSFGLTTLQNRHVNVRGAEVRFFFRGKSGVKHTIDLENARLAKIVKQLRDLPGYELFQYVDDEGQLRKVESGDVNQYIREAADDEFTAKDFRTWAGTMLAAQELRNVAYATSKEAQQNLKTAMANVAGRLGNTVAVCRKCYVHPAILDGYLKGAFPGKASSARKSLLKPEEAEVVAFLARAGKPVTLERQLAKSLRHARAATQARPA